MGIFCFILTVCTLEMAEIMQKKEEERFKKHMVNTLRYILCIGVVFCFFEFLAASQIAETFASKVLAFAESLTPIRFMAAVSVLFLVSVSMEKWTMKIGKKQVSG